jgi:hypothetical protein
LAGARSRTWAVVVLGLLIVTLLGSIVFLVLNRDSVVEVGDEGRVGPFAVSLPEPAQKLAMLGAGTPPLGSTYVVIAVTVRQEGATAARFDSAQALLVRGDGVKEQIDASSMSLAAGILSDNPFTDPLELAAGESVTGRLVFVVPQEAAGGATLLVTAPDAQEPVRFDVGLR